jgi:hypothetical protein
VGVNKPGEGEPMVCRLCKKEGHKSYQCKTEREIGSNLFLNDFGG